MRGTTTVTDETGAEVVVLTDPRSRHQKQLNVILGVLTAGLRASRDAASDLRAVGTIIAIITLPQLKAGVGTGWLTGSDQPIPAGILQRMACDAKIRVMVLGTNNTPLFETVVFRYFTPTPRQRRPTTPHPLRRKCERGDSATSSTTKTLGNRPPTHPVHAAFAPRHPHGFDTTAARSTQPTTDKPLKADSRPAN
ncbi:MAG TPA: DUF222 domain-containing protein [Galbitalea sp.]